MNVRDATITPFLMGWLVETVDVRRKISGGSSDADEGSSDVVVSDSKCFSISLHTQYVMSNSR